MHISPLRIEDLDALAPVYTASFRDSEWREERTLDAAMDALREALSFPHFFGRIARVEDTVAGAIYGHIRTYANGKTFYIDELFVAPSFRKQGIATALYDEAVARLLERGVGGAFFTTLRNSAAYAFYSARGAIDLRDSAVFYHPFSALSKTPE